MGRNEKKVTNEELQTLKAAKVVIEKLARSLGVDISELDENYGDAHKNLENLIVRWEVTS